jgi:hypothetical protein
MPQTMRLLILVCAVSFYAAAQCPATIQSPGTLFVPPAPYSRTAGSHGFWYGSDNLWTHISGPDFAVSGTDHISAKLTYFRVGFDSDKEPEPDLAVVARRLDGSAPLVWAEKAAGAKFGGSNAPSEMAMMTGISIPTAGCWEISSNYKGRVLTYVVNVTEQVPLRNHAPAPTR